VSTGETRRVVVVGGGVAGLAAAYRLLHPAPTGLPEGSPPDIRARPEVTVIEADSRVGGKVRSAHVADLTLEAGADSFVARKPWAVDLCRELGLGSELVAPASSAAYLWTDDGLVSFLRGSAFGIPSDVGDVMRWPGLSRAGRLRAAQDLVRKPRKAPGDESLGSLLRRRLGDEATDLAVGPLLAGLFAGNVDRLSVLATFPELTAWEREQGSLIRGAQAARSAAEREEPGPMFLKLAGGTERLTDALADAVGRERLVLDRPAERIEPDGDDWAVRGAAGALLSADALIVAIPAYESARLLAAWPEVSAELQRIPYVSTGVVFLVYPEGTSDALPEGTGFVVPAGRAPMTACTWLSNKWPREEYGSRAVVRCYVGGAGAEDVIDAADDEIVDAVSRHLAALLPLPARPHAWGIHRWRRAMPQYEVGHQDRVRAIRAGLPGGIFLTGSAYGGVGIPDSIRDAAEAAAAVGEYLARRMHQDKETVR
jgi:protoporphyrinogen/coproporphyrinogen III oxidase